MLGEFNSKPKPPLTEFDFMCQNFNIKVSSQEGNREYDDIFGQKSAWTDQMAT